jgi:ATP-dependent DNA helicase 2 subunit 2
MLIFFREPAEYVPIDDSFNPSIHRVNHAVKVRAVHPEKAVPETPPILLRFSSPPEELMQRVQDRIDALVQAAEVKKGRQATFISALVSTNCLQVPPKAKGKYRKEAVKPISGLDVDALLGDNRRGKITPENAVPDFKQALASSDELEEIESAAKQMGGIIETLVTDSFGDSKYAQAIECIGVLREGMINMDEPRQFNTFIRALKKGLLSGALGGDRRDFWFKIRWSRLGLIDQNESEPSDVTAEEVTEVRYAYPCRWNTANSLLVLQVEMKILSGTNGQ